MADRILVTEKISDEGLARLRAGAEVIVQTTLDHAALLATLPEYDALVVRSATKVNAEVLAAGTRLRVVGRAGTGVDNIDVDAATRQGILVVNAPASNSVAVAELTLGMILALARRIPQAHASLQGGKWERNAFMGFEVRGKTLGLVGLGRIGAEVARRARAFEMTVVAYDPVVSSDRAAQLGVALMTLDDVLATSDFVSLHVPLIDSTRNLIDATRMAQMKPGSFVINAARGGLVDEVALRAALDSGHLGGAALDVFAVEPPKENALAGHPHVVTTPHLGASTTEAQVLTGLDVAEGVLAALAGESPPYAVNAPYIAPEIQGILGPYVLLARKMGQLCTHLMRDPVRIYEIEYQGELARHPKAPVRQAILQGLLSGTRVERVTPVNAPLLARDLGLKYSELAAEDGQGYAGALVLRAQAADGPHAFVGTIINGVPHIVEADNFRVTFEPSGVLFFTYHRDRPGLIGQVGVLLGQNDVNISSMDVGRIAPREQAMMVLRLDNPAPASVVEQVRRSADVQDAVTLTL